MEITFIPKTKEIVKLNQEAEEEFISGKELKIEDLVDNEEECNLHYNFYCNVNLLKKK